jgi:hypothetical protein
MQLEAQTKIMENNYPCKITLDQQNKFLLALVRVFKEGKNHMYIYI